MRPALSIISLRVSSPTSGMPSRVRLVPKRHVHASKPSSATSARERIGNPGATTQRAGQAVRAGALWHGQSYLLHVNGCGGGQTTPRRCKSSMAAAS